MTPSSGRTSLLDKRFVFLRFGRARRMLACGRDCPHRAAVCVRLCVSLIDVSPVGGFLCFRLLLLFSCFQGVRVGRWCVPAACTKTEMMRNNTKEHRPHPFPVTCFNSQEGAWVSHCWRTRCICMGRCFSSLCRTLGMTYTCLPPFRRR